MLQRHDRVVLVATIIAIVAAAGLRVGGANDVLRFVAAAAALSLLAVNVSRGTEQLGAHLGPAATGILQAALGNLPELLVCTFALRAGLVSVVQGALIGSILANSLLVLGLAIFVGGLKHGRLHYDAESPRLIVSLMMLVVGALTIPTLAFELHTPAAGHEKSLSVACSLLLLAVFLASLPFSLGSDPKRSARQITRDMPAAEWSLPLATVTLVCASIGAAVVSDWFVESLQPAIGALHISQAFAGIVVVSIAGNAVENVAGVRLAWRNRPDYAMSVILNSSLLIALVVIPLLVLFSVAFGGGALTLVLPPLLIAALLLTTLTSAFVVNDGEATWIEGVALIGLYGIFAAAFWWG